MIEMTENGVEQVKKRTDRELEIDTAINDITHQAKLGGREDLNKEGGTGPYWLRAKWQRFTENSTKFLLKRDVPQEKITEIIQEAEKEIEFID